MSSRFEKIGFDISEPLPKQFEWIYDDGGRGAAGFRGEAGDCFCRAISIATGQPYRVTYDEIARRMALAGKPRTAREGVTWKIAKKYMADLGWIWTPTMRIGSGCTVHLQPDELPAGRLLVRISRWLTPVVDGVIRDTYDPRREARCVYGYWMKG